MGERNKSENKICVCPFFFFVLGGGAKSFSYEPKEALEGNFGYWMIVELYLNNANWSERYMTTICGLSNNILPTDHTLD